MIRFIQPAIGLLFLSAGLVFGVKLLRGRYLETPYHPITRRVWGRLCVIFTAVGMLLLGFSLFA